jgi:hypothetical protein
MKTNKYITEQLMVGIVHSEFHGCGWSTWHNLDPDMMFDPALVDLVLDGDKNKIEMYIKLRWPDTEHIIIPKLAVTFVPEGTRFRIEEYDGLETVVTEQDYAWITA